MFRCVPDKQKKNKKKQNRMKPGVAESLSARGIDPSDS